MMQPMKITEIEKQIDKVQNDINELEQRILNLNQQKRNLKATLEMVKKLIQNSGVKY